MVIRIINKFKRLIQMLLLAALSGLHPATASLLDQPVITLSLTDCEKAYLVRIFENGRVEYRGGRNVKIPGRHESQISKPALEALLKKFDAANITADDRENLPSMSRRNGPNQAIRLRHDNLDITYFVTQNRISNARFAMLKQEIMRTTKADKWLFDPNFGRCLERHAIRINDLKIK
jgi:hypothetical protein